jgi:hypothetical protein
LSLAVLSTIDKMCFTCRRETAHAFVGRLGGKPLYQCPCGAPPRHLTPRHELTSVPRQPEAPAKLQPEPAIRRPSLQRRHPRRPPMPAKNAPFLRTAIEKVVDEKLAEAAVGLSREDVVKIVQEQLAAALGEPAFICPRKPHRGTCGKKCRAAAADAAT